MAEWFKAPAWKACSRAIVSRVRIPSSPPSICANCGVLMNITFVPLVKSHFLLLIKWLQTAHVRLWWDQDIKWTPELIEKKYGDYVNGSKSVNKSHGEFKKPIYAYIIYIDNVPIGYIQYYNLYDFPSESCPDLSELPKSCASLDLYIGEVEFIGKNIGSTALSLFLEQYVFPRFDYIFVDPDITNLGAIRAYEKAGFRKAKEQGGIDELWMIREK